MALNTISQLNTLCDLSTVQFGASTAGTYLLRGTTSLPTLSGGGGQSQVVATVKQNGTTCYTGLPGAAGWQVFLECVAGDSITVAHTSSAAVDQTPNVIKSVISFG